MAKILDPHGLHDWSSEEYVHDWATRQDRCEDERRPQFQMIADAIPFSRDAAIQILDVGAGYGALTQFLLEEFPNTTALCQEGSDEMAKLGRRRMAKWKGRFDYVIADFSKRRLEPDDSWKLRCGRFNHRHSQRSCSRHHRGHL